MKRVLLVEDDEFKKDRVLSLIAGKYDVEITTSVRDAIVKLSSSSFDVIILDMALPSHDAGPGSGPSTSMLTGGIEIIAEVALDAPRSEKIVVLTQYPEIEVDGNFFTHGLALTKLREIYGGCVSAVVHYNDDRKDWERSIMSFLEDVGR